MQAALARAESELGSYKGRAHALLKAKDAELGRAREEARSELAADLAQAQDAAAAAATELQRVRVPVGLSGADPAALACMAERPLLV